MTRNIMSRTIITTATITATMIMTATTTTIMTITTLIMIRTATTVTKVKQESCHRSVRRQFLQLVGSLDAWSISVVDNEIRPFGMKFFAPIRLFLPNSDVLRRFR
jgi:hypothetical protein